MNQELASLPENPTPQDFGFPEKPTAQELQRWANQERWLEAFSRNGSVGAACAETGIPVSTMYRWGDVDDWSFKRRREMAGEAFLGRVEAEINRRAIEGTDKPIIYQGQVYGTYKEYSDNLLMFRAKKLDPSYRDNQPVHQDNRHVSITKVTYVIHNTSGQQLPDSSSLDSIDAGNQQQLPAPESVDDTGHDG